MKKLIALAVAAAAMPAMADITLSGSARVEYVDTDASTVVEGNDLDLDISASTELNNGMTVSTSFEANDGADAAQLTIAGGFGTLSIGGNDMAGALDSVDGGAFGTARDDLGHGVGADADIVYTLPTLVEGLTLKASMMEEGTGNDDNTSVAFKYTMGGLTIAGGQDSFGDSSKEDASAYSVAYTINGLTVGYGASENSDEAETSAVNVGYVMGDLTIAYNAAETEDSAGTTTSDKSTVSAKYNLGGGVSVHVSSLSVDTDTAATPAVDTTRVGMTFAF